MASPDSPDPGFQPLDPKLFSDNDDEEDIFWKQKLNALINGTVTPSEAATDYDSCVVEDANRRHAELLKRPDPRNLTAEEEERLSVFREFVNSLDVDLPERGAEGGPPPEES